MVASYVKTKFDIGLTRYSGVTVGFMLRQKNGVPQYGEFDSKFLADQFFSGSPDQTYQDPEKEIPLSQDDWRDSLGLKYFESTEPKRYFQSVGMDMRFRNMAIAGWQPTAVTNPTNPAPLTVPNNGMETPDVNWSIGGGNSTFNTVIYRSGTQSLRIGNGTGTDTREGFQLLSGWKPGYQYKLEGWVRTDPSVVAAIVLHDGISGTAVNITSTNTFGQFNTSHTVAYTATKLNAILRAYTGGAAGDAFFDDITIPMAQTNVVHNGVSVAAIDFNGNQYRSFGKVIAKLAANGSAFDFVYQLPVNVSSVEKFIDNMLYIAQNTGATYYKMNTAEGFSVAGYSAQTNFYQYFKALHTANPTLYGNDSGNTIRTCLTPNNANSWSSQTTVGSIEQNITGIIAAAGTPYIMKEDMPYYLDSVGAVQNDLAPELATEESATSGKNAYVWQNKIYIPAGNQTLLESDSGVNQYLNPSDYCTELAKFSGRIQALASDHRYLFAILNAYPNVEVIAGRDESIDGSTSWRWHSIAEIPIDGCESAFVSTVYQKRLWITSTNGAQPVYYIPLPTGYGDILNDVNRKFKSGGYFHTPYLHGDFRYDDKGYIKLTAVLGHTFNTGRYFEAHYRTLSNSSWTDLGDLKGSATSMISTLYFPANTFNPMTQLNFCANTDDINISPVLLGYNLQAILYPERRKTFACIVRASDEIQLKDSTTDSGSQRVIVATLDEIRDAKWPITFYDIDGSSHSVKVLPLPSGTPWRQPVKIEQDRTIEWEYNLLLQEVTTS